MQQFGIVSCSRINEGLCSTYIGVDCTGEMLVEWTFSSEDGVFLR